MDDSDRLAELKQALNEIDTSGWQFDRACHGFDLDLIGFDCRRAIEMGDPWECPWSVKCGHVPGKDCPLMRQRVRVHGLPTRPQ